MFEASQDQSTKGLYAAIRGICCADDPLHEWPKVQATLTTSASLKLCHVDVIDATSLDSIGNQLPKWVTCLR